MLAEFPQTGEQREAARSVERFDVAVDDVAPFKRLEKTRVVDDCERRHERADEVLLAEKVDAVLDGNARIRLREDGARHPHDADAAMAQRRGERLLFEDGTTT